LVVGPRHAVVVVVLVRVETLVGLRRVEVLPHLGGPLVVLGVPAHLGILVDVEVVGQARAGVSTARARLTSLVLLRHRAEHGVERTVETSLLATVFRAGGTQRRPQRHRVGCAEQAQHPAHLDHLGR
jgi:hypothetical protein